jgi:hypothetical protein
LSEDERVDDPVIRHEGETLAELRKFDFQVSLIIWYDILFQIDVVSKSMQKKNRYSLSKAV